MREASGADGRAGERMSELPSELTTGIVDSTRTRVDPTRPSSWSTAGETTPVRYRTWAGLIARLGVTSVDGRRLARDGVWRLRPDAPVIAPTLPSSDHTSDRWVVGWVDGLIARPDALYACGRLADDARLVAAVRDGRLRPALSLEMIVTPDLREGVDALGNPRYITELATGDVMSLDLVTRPAWDDLWLLVGSAWSASMTTETVTG